MKKRLLSWLLIAAMTLSLLPTTVFAAGGTPTALTASTGVTLGTIKQRYDVGQQEADIEITTGGTYELTGTKGGISVIVKTTEEVILVLNGLTMTGEKSPIQLQAGANVTLVLKAGTKNVITCTATEVTVTTTVAKPGWTPDLDAGETEEDHPQITVPGNDGMTAGINVPENATLTIDKVKDETAGALTVQGGYGGAGIGGGAATPGYTEEVGKTGASGGNGQNGNSNGRGTQAGMGGSGGAGGSGGLFGKNAEDAGTVVINAGALTVTGGENAAGIGGGRGADGQTATESGKPGSNGYGGYYNFNLAVSFFSGGGGGSGGNGGNGGNGGKGGSLKALTITGGTVKVTGGEKATGIGGGNGGTGGNGGSGGTGGTGNNGGGLLESAIGGRGGDGATGAVGFRGASPGGNGGTVKITGGRVEITGYVAVGAGRTLWPSALTYNRNHNGSYNYGKQGNSNKLNGGFGGYNNANERPEPTADNGSLTIQNASVKLNNTVPEDELKREFPNQAENLSNGGNRDLTMPNNYVRPMNGKATNEPIYHLALTVKRLDQVTICEDADINLVLYRGDNAKQYTYTTTTGTDGVAHLWLPAIAKKGNTGKVEDDYNMYATGNEIAHRAVGRLMPDTKLGIAVESNDNNNTLTAYIGVDYSAGATPNDTKVYRYVDNTTYELLDDGKGEVKLRIDARTVPEDMKIIQLRWFRENVNGNDQEYDFYVHGSTKEFGKRFDEIQTERAVNTGSSDASDVKKCSVKIDMAPEQGEVGRKPRIWDLPMKENGRYWVELTYQAGTETPQKVVKGVVINNIFTSYPLWVRGFWALNENNKEHEPLSWLYGNGGTGENWQTSKAAEYVRLLGANKQPQTQPYGIPWDLDGYSAAAMKDSYTDEQYDYATKILETRRVFTPTGAIDGYDRVKIYVTDVLKTLYNADVGNFDANHTSASIALNTGTSDTPKELTLNAGYFASSATHYGEIVDGKQLFNKYLVRYLARDGALNIVLMSGVDEAQEPLYDDVKMFTPEITDADIRGWERPGAVVTKVEYAGVDNNWVDITPPHDKENSTEQQTIQTDLEGLKATFSKIADVKKVRFTYKKTATDVTIKAYYDTPEGEPEREIEGFVPYTIEADYGKYYTPTPLDLTKFGFERTRSNLTDDKILVKDPADQTFQEGIDNVIKFYFKKTEGNVTYRAVVKGEAGDGSDDQVVWSKNTTVAINTAPQTQFTDGETAIPPTLTNYVLEGENGNVTITRQNGGAAATTYDGLHDLYVTYEYKKKTKDVKIVAINALSGDPITLEPDAATVQKTTGEYHTFTAPDLAAKGYKVLQSQATQSYFVAADAQDPSVTFLYLPTENAETTVTLYYLDSEKEETIQVLRNEVKWGDTLTLQLPNIKGYTIVPNQDGVDETTGEGTGETKYSVTLNPKRDETGANATGTTIKVKYEKVAPVTITVKLVEQNVADSNLADKLINWTGTILVEKGGNATVTPPNIPGYTLVTSDPASNPGESLQLTNVTADQTVTFTYAKNYVTVKTFTNTDGNTNAAYQPGIEVVKTETATLNPPLRTGYVLKGIKVVTKGETDTTVGGEETYPNGWNAATSTLTLSNLSSDTEVTYYYKTIEEALPEHQVTITVIEKHEAFTMSEKTYKVTKDREVVKNHTYGPNTYAGYRVASYQVDDEVKQEITGASTDVQVDHFKNHTITYTFVRTDGSVTVPGKDEKLPSKDDITIKPTDPTQKPTVDLDNGTVTVPDKGGKVVTPDGTVVVPGGSTVDKDGSIKGPGGKPIDPSNPGEVTGHYFIQYKANGGVGESYTEYFKTDATVTLKTVGELFTKDGFTTNNWNTYANGNGDRYEETKEVSGKSLTLFAQWAQKEQATGRYTATVTLKPNGASGNDDTYTIASNDNDPIREKIKANPFKLDGWTFKGWLTGETSGTYYVDEAVAGVENGKTLTLYAQWIKVAEDGSITVPGGDKLPNTSDDVTAKPGNGGSLKRDDATGVITVPAGGSAVNKNGEIDMPNGGTVKPDGTIIVNNGDGTSTTVKPDGTVEEGSNTFAVIFKSGVKSIQNITKYVKTGSSINADADIFNYDGHVFAYWTKDNGEKFVTNAQISEAMTLTANWYQQKEDGSVVIPAPGGNGEIIVKPEGENKPSVDKDGNVKIPGTGPVVTPDGPVVVPDGSVVKPDGSIVKPGTDGGNEDKIYPVPANPSEKPEGYIVVTYKVGTVDNAEQYKDVRHSDKGASITVLGSQFDIPGKTFLYWLDAFGKKYEKGDPVNSDTVLTAQWKNAGSVVLSIKAGSNVKEGVTAVEKLLVMSGSWTGKTEDKQYVIPVQVDGVDASNGDLRWYVDADSYTNEFGFTNRVLTGDDIVSVNAQTGEITVKNSGIVRIYCESKSNPNINFSVVVVVPGDVTKDGIVDLEDAMYIMDVANSDSVIPEVDVTNMATWYFKELMDVAVDGTVDLEDCMAVFDFANGDADI